MPDPLIALLVGLVGLIVALALFWPGGGLASRWQRMHALSLRVLQEDALKHLFKSEQHGQRPTRHTIAGALHISADQTTALLAVMQQHELVTLSGDEVSLTPVGRDSALHVIRAHRLWERHLADDTGFAEPEWHVQAELYEHRLSPQAADALAARLGQPTRDPHGDPIPTSAGDMVPHGGRPLTTVAPGARVRIVHIEDEPEAVYAQIVAEGLYPGLVVNLTEALPQRVRFWANGDEHVLAPIVANNLSVVPVTPEPEAAPAAGEPLTALKPGEKGQVVNIAARCRGPERRRLMDLGILPGTPIEAELAGPGGDPTAYRIRGALIALRREQARLIHITRSRDTVI